MKGSDRHSEGVCLIKFVNLVHMHSEKKGTDKLFDCVNASQKLSSREIYIIQCITVMHQASPA